jgi:hypothetical protein
MDIKVIDNAIGLGDKSIQVVINNVKFSCDAIGEPYIMFWIDEDKADSLVFHLSAVLEDRQRAKDSQKTS